MAFEFSKLLRWNLKKGEVASVAPSNAVALPCAALQFDPGAWEWGNVRDRFPDLTRLPKSGSYHYWYNISSNCYAYALGDVTLFLDRVGAEVGLDPGVISGKHHMLPPEHILPDTLVQLAKSDGLKQTGDKIVFEPNTRPVALFVCNHQDYHWLRLDKRDDTSKMVWSHKFRTFSPKIVTDKKGNTINDPRNLKIPLYRKSHYRFVSFFNVPNDLSMSGEALTTYQKDGKLLLLEPELRSWQANGRIPIPQLG
ncbi:MAG: hypothetical protein WCD70_13475 [Alphaproteobacteria bacterium]